MPPGVEAVVESEEGRAGLSWRSRTASGSNWWTSAVDLSSSLISKMDQLPWHAGARDETKTQPQRGQEFAGFWTESFEESNKRRSEITRPVAKSLELGDKEAREEDAESPKPREGTTETRRRVAESRRRTKRMPVELAPGPACPKQDMDAPIRSKRLSAVSQDFLLGQGSQSTNPARVHSIESLPRRQSSQDAMNLDATIRRVDDASILSSRRSSGHHSSRSFCQGSLLEETIRKNPPHALPQPPGSDGIVHVNKPEGSVILKEEVFPGNTNNLAQLKCVGNFSPKRGGNHPSRLSQDPVLGGSSRVTRSCEGLELEERKAPSTSLPTSPRLNTNSKESRTSKLMRKFKLSGIGGRVGTEITTTDSKSGKRNSLGEFGKLSKEKGSKVVNNLIVSQQQKFVKSLEPRKAGITNGVRSSQELGRQRSIEREKAEGDGGNWIQEAPTIHSKCLNVDSDGVSRADNRSQGSVRNQEGNAALQEKKSSSRWLFKWRWGSKPATRISIATVQRGDSLQGLQDGSTHSSATPDERRNLSPTVDVMSDARDSFFTTNDRHSSDESGEKVALGKKLKQRRASSWGCASHASTAAITPVNLQRDATAISPANGENKVESRVRRSLDCDLSQSFRIGEAYQDCQESFWMTESPRTGRGSFRSAAGQSFRTSEAFEDCHGSFRSVASTGSCGSFRNVDSPTMRGIGGRRRNPSVEEIELESRLPDQTLTIGDVAVLCNSSLKFVFKCREVQHFNKVLKSQKARLLSASEKGNTDCFNVILSGVDIEVSSMVAAISYAWLLENKVPKATSDAWHAVPMIDIPRHQMHKHKDAAWLFDACGIDPAALLYADEIELTRLVAAGRIKISVIGQDVLETRNEVGSVCTVLGEKLVAEAQCLLEPRYMKTLLLAGILLDTENLDFASLRDTEMTTSLLVGSGSLGRNGFFEQLREVEDDDRVVKFITRNYGDGKQLSGRRTCSGAQAKIQQEAEQEQSDKDSVFTQSQDQTSTSEAGTSSSLDEDSPRLKQRSSFKNTKLKPHSAPAKSHQLPSPSSARLNEDEQAVAHIRKAATQPASSRLTASGTRSPNSTRIRRKLFLYQA